MNHQELFTELTAIGMNLKQAKLYVAALQLGTVPASRIANKAEINRATAYHSLDEMAKDGYVVISDRVGTRHYTAIEPDKLLSILEEKKMEIARKQERLSGVISMLADIRQNKTVEPTVKFYEGRMGLKDLMRRSLRANDVIRGWDLTKDFDKDFLKFLREEFVPERIRKGIKTNVIANEGAPQVNSEYLREIRVLPDKSLDVDMRVYNNTVMIISYAPEEYFGVEIESPYIAQSLKGIFDTIWNMLPENVSTAENANSSPKKKKAARSNQGVTVRVQK